MTLTSELEAVNTMLATIQSTQVSSLSGPLPADASMAKDILREIRRAVCQDCWSFNYEREKPFSRNASNQIDIPPDVIAIDVSPGFNTDVDAVQRGDKLYDRKGHTFTFSSDLTCDVTLLLTWNELPEPARRYIMVRAARVLVDRLGLDQQSHQFTQQDEIFALAALKKFDAGAADRTIFDTFSMAKGTTLRKGAFDH